MPALIAALIAEGGGTATATRGGFVRSTLQSLANAYAATMRDIERLTGHPIRNVHLVGGGAQTGLPQMLSTRWT